MLRSAHEAVSKARASRQWTRQMLALLDSKAAAAKAVFLDGEGQLSKDGEKLLAAMAREAGMHRHGFQADADKRLFDAGAQHMVRWIADLIDVDTRQLARAMERVNE